jgi:predicted regulator of Ras-like GTPase activity (Roadblock/LC7/MglB family)
VSQSRVLEAAPRAQTTAQERNTKVERVLKNIVGLRGVTSAVVVDNDGLVTHAQKDFDINTDALGAAVQIAYGSAHQASDHVRLGATHLVIVESKEGIIVLAPLSKGLILALVADTSALLGNVRLEVKQTIPVLNELFA